MAMTHVIAYGNVCLLREPARPIAVSMAGPYGRYIWSAPREARSVETGRPAAGRSQVAAPPDPGAGWARQAVAHTCECALRGCHPISGDLSPGRAATEPAGPPCRHRPDGAG